MGWVAEMDESLVTTVNIPPPPMPPPVDGAHGHSHGGVACTIDHGSEEKEHVHGHGHDEKKEEGGHEHGHDGVACTHDHGSEKKVDGHGHSHGEKQARHEHGHGDKEEVAPDTNTPVVRLKQSSHVPQTHTLSQSAIPSRTTQALYRPKDKGTLLRLGRAAVSPARRARMPDGWSRGDRVQGKCSTGCCW